MLNSGAKLPPNLGDWEEKLQPTLKPAAETSWELQFDQRNSSHQQLPSPVQSLQAEGLAESLEDKLISCWICVCFHLDLHDEIKAAALRLARMSCGQSSGAVDCTVLPLLHFIQGVSELFEG